MFRRLLSPNHRRSAATGLLAISAYYNGASDGPSHCTSKPPLAHFDDLVASHICFPFPFRQMLTFRSLPFPDSDSNAEALGKNQADAPCPATSTERNFIAKAAALASPAVVNISVGKGGLKPSTSIGSGTIIDPDGTILTCAHCVEDLDRKKRVCNGKVVHRLTMFCELFSLNELRKFVGLKRSSDL
ncbi:hypothetical protein BHE74_00041697 [Ensete ventricosum]|nr:hypothetical protein BHE74_00041697 [Ensete ventricosum]